jgi:hypothetical protein
MHFLLVKRKGEIDERDRYKDEQMSALNLSIVDTGNSHSMIHANI